MTVCLRFFIEGCRVAEQRPPVRNACGERACFFETTGRKCIKELATYHLQAVRRQRLSRFYFTEILAAHV